MSPSHSENQGQTAEEHELALQITQLEHELQDECAWIRQMSDDIHKGSYKLDYPQLCISLRTLLENHGQFEDRLIHLPLSAPQAGMLWQRSADLETLIHEFRQLLHGH